VKLPRLRGSIQSQSPSTNAVHSAPTSGNSFIPLGSTAEPVNRGPDSILDEDETVVPRDSRLIQDAQGNLMFIGDCAPLSFLQTVRHMVTTFVDANAFVTQIGHDAMLEQTDVTTVPLHLGADTESLPHARVEAALSAFLAVTSGLLDLGIADDFRAQTNQLSSEQLTRNDVQSAVNLIILAIGMQSSDPELASTYYHRARNTAFGHLTFDTSPLTVQAFLLIAIYMLRSCQPNGAFLYFSLAARASYSIGMHRTEVNARFGERAQRQRERL
jgi:hypothetical protein